MIFSIFQIQKRELKQAKVLFRGFRGSAFKADKNIEMLFFKKNSISLGNSSLIARLYCPFQFRLVNNQIFKSKPCQGAEPCQGCPGSFQFRNLRTLFLKQVRLKK